jgi:polyhydroxyalkanoate synthesis regulator phasin
MIAKKILTTMVIVGALAIPFSVFAATSDTAPAKAVRGFFGIDASKLTDAQKTDVTDYTKKMSELQKEFVNKMVTNGSMTKEQGEAAIQRIENGVSNGTFLKGFDGGFGKHGRGGFGLFGADVSKLTDEQKADLNDSFKKIADIQKELINKQVASGLITKEQGDTAIEKIETSIEDGSCFTGMGRFHGFGIKNIDPSKLTEEQKAEMDEYSKKIAEVQEEIINKMVSNGSITKEQGDAAIERMENMPEGMIKGGFSKGNGMGREGFGGRRK